MNDKELPSNLPDLQRQELETIVQNRIVTGLANAIFLYGSFARGQFRLRDGHLDYPSDKVVPPKYTKKKSDFDVLVLTETPEAAQQLNVDTQDFFTSIRTPLDLKFLDFKALNTLHMNCEDFIKTVLKKRIVLYDNGNSY